MARLIVGSIHGGTKHNIRRGEAPDHVRIYSPAMRKQLLDGIVRIRIDTSSVIAAPKTGADALLALCLPGGVLMLAISPA